MNIGIVALGKFNKNDGGTTVLKGLLRYLPVVDKKNKYYIITCENSAILRWIKNYDVNIVSITCPSTTSLMRLYDLFFIPILLWKKHIKIDMYLCPNNYAVLTTTKKVVLIFQRRLFMFRELDSVFKLIYKNILLKLSLKKANIIFVASKYHRDVILKNMNIEKDRIKVAYLGVDAVKPKRSKKFDDLVDYKNNYIGLFVSVLRPYKNIEVLINMMKILKYKYELKNFKLVVVGDYPYGKYKNIREYKTKIDSLIRKNKLEGDVIFLGNLPHEEVMYIYSKADVFLFPSKFEGFGLPIIESMKSGLPVIASDIEVVREIAGNAAILVDPENPSKWAEAVNVVLNNDDVRISLIKTGLQNAKKYTWSNFAKQILKYIE